MQEIDIYKKLVTLREAGRYSEALKVAEEISFEPTLNTDILAELAHVYILLDDINSASICVKRATKIKDNNPLVELNRVRIFLKTGESESALKLAQRINKIHPDLVESLGVLGACLRVSNKLDESLSILNQALNRQPKYAEALINRGYLHLARNKNQEAVEDFKEAFKLKPHIKSIWRFLISLELKSEDYRSLLDNVLAMLEYEPKNTKIIDVIIFSVEKLDDKQIAVSAFEKVLESNSRNFRAAFCLAVASKRNGMIEKSIENFKLCISINAKSVDPYFQLANLYSHRNEIGEAARNYHKVITLQPNHTGALMNLGALQYRQGDLSGAALNFGLVIKYKPDAEEAYTNLGAIFKEMDETEKAINSFNTALKINPSHVSTLYNLSVTLQEKGELNQSLDYIKKANKIQPNDPQILNSFSSIEQKFGNLDNAIKQYQKAISINPDYIKPILNLHSLAVQLSNVSKEVFGLELNKTYEEGGILSTHPKFLIQEAIRLYIEKDFDGLDIVLKLFETSDCGEFVKLSTDERLFCSAFNLFLNRLIESNRPLTSDEGYKTIFHIGESHCLSYAHQLIEMDGDSYTITPLITFGAKAFHFTKPDKNVFKSITESNFRSLKKKSTVLLSFGEIDCRANEGFIAAARKIDKPLTEIISDTVMGYVEWFSALNKGYDHKLYFLNIPAPVFNESYSIELNQQISNVIRRFNNYLAKALMKSNNFLIDIYKETSEDTGFSNSKYHIDSVHLGSGIIKSIQKQLFFADK